MKKTIKRIRKSDYDIETLKHWKYSSVKAKLDWLSDAIEFARAVRAAKKSK